MRPEAAGAAADDATRRNATAGPLGILACAGPLPLEIAAAAGARGHAVHIVGISGFADTAIERYPHEYASLGQVGRILSGFRRAGCRDLVIAGGMVRPDLSKLKVDLGFFRHLPTVLALTRGGDDSVLRAIVRFFEAQGFTVRGAGEVAPHLLAGEGPIGSGAPTAADRRAIARAAALVAELGAFDIGQAVVASGDGILAIEGVRGTDAMLRDLAEMRPDAGGGCRGVLVKCPKPGQEMRIDLPTIGPDTVSRAAAAGLRGVAVAAGETIVIGRDEVARRADAAGLFVEGTQASPSSEALPASRPVETPLAVAARAAPTPFDRRDIALGRRLLPVLRRHATGGAAVIAGEHILAIAASLPVERTIRALGRRSHWGRRMMRSRIGTLVLDLSTPAAGAADAMLTREVFQAALEAGLAGICCLGGALPAERRDELIGWANDGRMFLMCEEAA